jgi:hypothetical protein
MRDAPIANKINFHILLDVQACLYGEHANSHSSSADDGYPSFDINELGIIEWQLLNILNITLCGLAVHIQL